MSALSLVQRVLVVLAFAASTTASAQTFLMTGHLDGGTAPANGTFPVTLSLVDGDATLWTEDQSLLVVDGVFAVDVGAATPLPETIPAGALLAVVIDGDVLPPTPLARLVSVRRATRADRADRALTTASVGGTSAATAVSAAALLIAGESSTRFSAIRGVRSDVLDGDQGTVVSGVADGLTLTGGTLAVGSVDGAKLATGVVGGASIASVTGGQIADGAITGAKVRDAELLRSSLAADVTEVQVKGKVAHLVTTDSCSVPKNVLTTRTSCSKRSCTIGGNPNAGRLNCGSGTCEFFVLGMTSTTCSNTALGVLAE